MKIDSTTHRQIIREAQRNGICAAWLEEMKSTDDARQLLDMFMRGIDFCLIHEYPSLEILRRFHAEAQAAGVYVDCQGMRTKNQARTACLGSTAGHIRYDSRHTGAIYIKHQSNITLVATDDSFVMVDIFDDASLKVEAWDKAKVCVNVYAEDEAEGPQLITRAGSEATVKVINKHKKSYK